MLLKLAIDTEKAFDSLDHYFIIFTLEKYGFGKNFILWVKILLSWSLVLSMLSMEVQLQNISHLGEQLVMVTQFQLFYLF